MYWGVSCFSIAGLISVKALNALEGTPVKPTMYQILRDKSSTSTCVIQEFRLEAIAIGWRPSPLGFVALYIFVDVKTRDVCFFISK